MCNVCLSRRTLFSAGLGALAVTASAAGARAQPARSADSPDAAFARLMEGNARYVSGQLTERDFSAGRVARTQGQKPFAAILGCADSRVAPELAFDQGPGELFVVRVAGNFVTPDGLGSLEYGAACWAPKLSWSWGIPVAERSARRLAPCRMATHCPVTSPAWSPP